MEARCEIGSAILGRIGVALESLTNPGEAVLLASTPISSLPISITTQPNALGGATLYSGQRLFIVVSGNTATGTLSIAGKDFSQAQNSVSETSPTIPVAGSASNPTSTGYEYLTTQVFSTINASGITASGLTNGSVKIYGLQAARILLPGMFDAEEKIPPHSPQEQRGLVSRDTNIIALNKVVDITKVEQVFYPDQGTWLPYMVTGDAPLIMPLTGASTQVRVTKSSTAVSGFPVTAAIQPNTLIPGAQVQFVVTGNSATGVITIVGTNISGVAITENIAIPAGNGTFTSVNWFATINTSGISITGMTGAALVVTNLLVTLHLAITAISALPVSLGAGQPNANGPDGILILNVTGSSAVGTVTIAGTNRYGVPIIEAVQCGVPGAANGNGFWYTQQAFTSVNTLGVSATGLTSGSVTIVSCPGFSSTWLAGPPGTGIAAGGSDQVYTGCFEWYTGTDAVALPFGYLDEVTLEGSPEKELKWTGKGGAQDMLDIGVRSTTPLVASTASTPIGAIGAFNSVWQPFDVELAGWQTLVTIDSISGTPGTTAYNAVLDWKLTFKRPQKPVWPAVNWQRFQKLYPQQRETDLALTIDFFDLLQYEQFRQNFIKQYVQFAFIGPPMGAGVGGTYYKQWTYTFACKMLTFKRDPSKMDRVEATLTCKTEFSPLLGWEYKLVVQNQQPPLYTS